MSLGVEDDADDDVGDNVLLHACAVGTSGRVASGALVKRFGFIFGSEEEKENGWDCQRRGEMVLKR